MSINLDLFTILRCNRLKFLGGSSVSLHHTYSFNDRNYQAGYKIALTSIRSQGYFLIKQAIDLTQTDRSSKFWRSNYNSPQRFPHNRSSSVRVCSV